MRLARVSFHLQTDNAVPVEALRRGMRCGALVGIRPSMKKFESSDLAVEVCSLARPMPAAINRQLIMALLSLGIASAVFMAKFEQHIRQLDHLLTGGEEALTVRTAAGPHGASPPKHPGHSRAYKPDYARSSFSVTPVSAAPCPALPTVPLPSVFQIINPAE